MRIGFWRAKTKKASEITSGRFPVDRLPAMTDEFYWVGTGGNVEERAVPAAAIIPKVKLETRDMTAESGDVSYTGYGFQPTGLIVSAWVSALYASWGTSEPALTEQCLYGDGSSPYFEGLDSLLKIAKSVSAFQEAVVKTYDVDGFTLTWTKGATPSGTATLHVFAFK